MVSDRTWRNLWVELRRSHLAKLGIVLVVLIVSAAVFAPLLAPHDPNKTSPEDSNLPPLGFSETKNQSTTQMVDGEIQTVTEEVEITFEDGDPIHAVGVVQDLTDRTERQRRLRETNHRLQAVIDTVDAAIFMKDADGTYQLLNDTAREILGLDEDADVTGLTTADLFPQATAREFRADDRHVLETGEPIRKEEPVPHSDGVHVHLTIKSPIFDADGEPSGICAVSTDISDRVDDG